MKFHEFEMSGHRIEFWNSLFGQETIYLDGRKVSERYSFTGTKHFFPLANDLFLLQSEYRLFERPPLKLTLFRGSELVQTEYFKIPKQQRIRWILMSFLTMLIIAHLTGLL